jgi:glutaredoxin 3
MWAASEFSFSAVARVQIYTAAMCPYCVRAKRLLERKQVSYEEIDVSMDDQARLKLMETTGLRTVPQIFIGDRHVGGSDDLHALEERGELDPLLQ